MDIDRFKLLIKELIFNSKELEENSKKFNETERLLIINSLLSLENEMTQLRKILQLPELDYSLFSENILASLNNPGNFSYFRPIEYQYSFLLFLFLNSNENEKSELNILVDLYFNDVKDQLTYEDIVKTKTGAVRCKTNLRFAVLRLRELGLVNYYDDNKKRNWMPSLLGFLVCSYICIKNKYSKENKIDIVKIKINSATDYDNKLISVIDQLSNSENFDSLLDSLQLNSLGLDSLGRARKLFKDYKTILSKYLDPLNRRYFTIEKRKALLKNFVSKLEFENDFRAFKRDLALKAKSEIRFNELMELISGF
jgi:hypothetical protein